MYLFHNLVVYLLKFLYIRQFKELHEFFLPLVLEFQGLTNPFSSYFNQFLTILVVFYFIFLPLQNLKTNQDFYLLQLLHKYFLLLLFYQTSYFKTEYSQVLLHYITILCILILVSKLLVLLKNRKFTLELLAFLFK